MNDLFKIILSSVVVGAIIKEFGQNQVNKLNMITAKRGEWRNDLKEIAQDIKKAKTDEIEEYLTKLKLNLNYYGFIDCKNNEGSEKLDIMQDEHIWKVVYEIEKCCKNESDNLEKFEYYKEELIDYIGLLLKFDWDRSKYETSNAFDYAYSIILLFIAGIVGIFVCYLYNPKWTVYQIVTEGIMFVLPGIFMLIPIWIQKIDSQINHNLYRKIDYFKIPIIASGITVIILIYYISVLCNENSIIIIIVEGVYLMSIAYPVMVVYKEKKFYMKYEEIIKVYINYNNRKIKKMKR